MLFIRFRVDQEVVDLQHPRALTYQLPEDLVNHGLERGRRIAQPNRPHQVLTKAVLSAGLRLPFAPLGYSNEAVAVPKVKLARPLQGSIPVCAWPTRRPFGKGFSLVTAR